MTALLIERIESLIASPPLFIQLAKEGVWERAWKLHLSEGPPSETWLKSYARGGEDDIAVEVFFRCTEGRELYFGLRHSRKLKPGLDPVYFLTAFFRGVFEFQETTFSTMVNGIVRELSGDPPALFAGDPDHIDIGVVNYWKSAGSCTVWRKEAPKVFREKDLVHMLAGQNKSLLRNRLHYLGLEFKYLGSLPHWISFEASEKRGSEFFLSVPLVMEKLKTLLDFQ